LSKRFPVRLAIISFLFGAIGAIGIGASANAVGSVDQQFVVSGSYSSYGGFDSTILRGQSFTAGTSGLVDRITIDMRRTGNPGVINASLYLASNGVPAGTALATTTVNQNDVSSSSVTSVIFDFSTPATVTAGSSYVLVLAAPNAVTGMMAPSNNYRIYNGPATPPTGMHEVWSQDNGTTWTTGGWSFYSASYITPVIQPSATPSSSPSVSVVNSGGSSLANTGIASGNYFVLFAFSIALVVAGIVAFNIARVRSTRK
jgi:hypothetical protein